MLGLKEPLVPPFTPQQGFNPEEHTSPLSSRSHGSYTSGSGNGYDTRRTSFRPLSYRSSAVLETGSAIPLQFSQLDEPREIQIRRARDSIVGMSSVLSDMKSQINNVRRASQSSAPAAAMPTADEPAEPSPSSTSRADRAARIKALGAPWMPTLDQNANQNATPRSDSPHGPPPAFKAPLSPLSPPEKIGSLHGRNQGSPFEIDSYTTAEEQASDEDPNRVMPTLPRLSSTNWRDLISPSPTKNLHSKPRRSLRQAALGSDNEEEEEERGGGGGKVEAPEEDKEGKDIPMQDYGVMNLVRDSQSWTDINNLKDPKYKDLSIRESNYKRRSPKDYGYGNSENAARDLPGVKEDLTLHKVRRMPAVREMSTEPPQEAKICDARAPSVTSPSVASAHADESFDLDFGVPPVPPRHDHHIARKGHHRYHDLGEDANFKQHSRTQSQPQTQPHSATHSQSASRPRPHSQPSSQPHSQSQSASHSQPHMQSHLQAAAPQSKTRSSTTQPHRLRSHSGTRSQLHSRSQPPRSQSQSKSKSTSKPHSESVLRDRYEMENAEKRRSFTKKSITNLVETAPPDHVYDLDEIDLPGPERRLLEKFINSLSKLSIEIQMDAGKRDEGRRRLNNALRALEGWI